MRVQERGREFRLRHNLTDVLRRRGMTAAELSRRTGVAKQVLSDWSAGVQPRKLEQLYAVARALELSMDDLCFAAADEIAVIFGPKGRLVDGDSSHGSHGSYNGGGSGDLGHPLAELRGRYEIYLKRIDDDGLE